METERNQLESFLGDDDAGSDAGQEGSGADDVQDQDEPGTTTTVVEDHDDKPAPKGKAKAKPKGAAPAKSAGQAQGKSEGEADATGDEVPEGDESATAAARARDPATGRFTGKDVADEMQKLRTELQRQADELAKVTRERDGFRGAMRDERGKRQQGDGKPKGFDFNDPDSSLEDFGRRLTAQFDQRFYDLAEEHARTRHADYDPTVDELMNECEQNEALGRQVFQHIQGVRDPAEALYRFALNRRELKAFGGDVGQYRASIEKPLKEQLDALTKERDDLKKRLEQREKVPTSLSNRGSQRPGAASDDDDGEESLDDILEPVKNRKSIRKRA